jgi:hypothetical protein
VVGCKWRKLALWGLALFANPAAPGSNCYPLGKERWAAAAHAFWIPDQSPTPEWKQWGLARIFVFESPDDTPLEGNEDTIIDLIDRRRTGEPLPDVEPAPVPLTKTLADLAKLTPREREYVQLRTRRLTNAEVGAAMGVTKQRAGRYFAAVNKKYPRGKKELRRQAILPAQSSQAWRNDGHTRFGLNKGRHIGEIADHDPDAIRAWRADRAPYENPSFADYGTMRKLCMKDGAYKNQPCQKAVRHHRNEPLWLYRERFPYWIPHWKFSGWRTPKLPAPLMLDPFGQLERAAFKAVMAGCSERPRLTRAEIESHKAGYLNNGLIIHVTKPWFGISPRTWCDRYEQWAKHDREPPMNDGQLLWLRYHTLQPAPAKWGGKALKRRAPPRRGLPCACEARSQCLLWMQPGSCVLRAGLEAGRERIQQIAQLWAEIQELRRGAVTIFDMVEVAPHCYVNRQAWQALQKRGVYFLP